MRAALFRGRVHWLVRGRPNFAETRSDFQPQQHSSTGDNRHASPPRHPTSKRRGAAQLSSRATRPSHTGTKPRAARQPQLFFLREIQHAKSAGTKPFKIACLTSRRTLELSCREESAPAPSLAMRDLLIPVSLSDLLGDAPTPRRERHAVAFGLALLCKQHFHPQS